MAQNGSTRPHVNRQYSATEFNLLLIKYFGSKAPFSSKNALIVSSGWSRACSRAKLSFSASFAPAFVLKHVSRSPHASATMQVCASFGGIPHMATTSHEMQSQ